MHIFGGHNKKANKVFNDLWKWDKTNEWKRVHLKGKAKLEGRYYHSFAINNGITVIEHVIVTGCLYLIGGRNSKHLLANCMEEYNLCSISISGPFDSVPNDILILMFSYLDERDLSKMKAVCKRFRNVASKRTTFHSWCSGGFIVVWHL